MSKTIGWENIKIEFSLYLLYIVVGSLSIRNQVNFTMFMLIVMYALLVIVYIYI